MLEVQLPEATVREPRPQGETMCRYFDWQPQQAYKWQPISTANYVSEDVSSDFSSQSLNHI